MIRKALTGEQGPRTEDLVLENVVLVEGFHVNIISEPLAREKGIWYEGWNCTLQYGKPEESVTLMELKRAYNLVFFEYNPLTQYSVCPHAILTSSAGIFALLAIKLAG